MEPAGPGTSGTYGSFSTRGPLTTTSARNRSPVRLPSAPTAGSVHPNGPRLMVWCSSGTRVPNPVPAVAALQVGQDLGLGGVGPAPPRVELEGEGVEVGWNVAGRSGVRCCPARSPPTPSERLVDGERIPGPLEPDTPMAMPPAPAAEDGDGRLPDLTAGPGVRDWPTPRLSTSSTGDTVRVVVTALIPTPETTTRRGTAAQLQSGASLGPRVAFHVGDHRHQGGIREWGAPGKPGPPKPARPATGPKVDQLDDSPASARSGPAEEHGGQRGVDGAPSKVGQSPSKTLVHQHHEAQAVPPEPQAPSSTSATQIAE